MSDYGRQLITDLPDQFKGKSRIEALLRAIGHQFDELVAFYDDLNLKRTIDTAEGAQLDMIGDIVCLTRAEAAETLSLNSKTVDDDTYRIVLYYKIMLNSSNCTYYDIMQSMDLVYGNNGMTYREEPTIPATIIIDIPEISIDEDQTYLKLLKIKPAGVKILWDEHFHIWMYVKSNVMLHNIHFFRLAFDFWNIRKFDGDHWNLDGEYLLDAHSRYGIRVVTNTIMKIYECEDMSHLKITTGNICMYVKSSVMLHNIHFFRMAMDFWNIRRFDGYHWNLDGEYLLDAHSRYGIRIVTNTIMKIREYEDMSHLTITTWNKDIWYFNGEFMLDGTKKLNSQYEREEF